MTKIKSPAYQWYPKDIIGSQRVKLMSILQEGAYRIALDSCWLYGSLPNDPKLIAKIIGKGCTAKLASEIIHMFIKDPDDQTRLISERQEVERNKQKEFGLKQKENGLKGGRPKANPDKSQKEPKPLKKDNPKKPLHIASAFTSADNNLGANAPLGTEVPAAATKNDYEKLITGATEAKLSENEVWTIIKNFVNTKKPTFITPYLDLWNILAGRLGLAKVKGASGGRENKFSVRIREEAFDYVKILAGISQQKNIRGAGTMEWKVDFDWILENDTNYLKILEGKYK